MKNPTTLVAIILTAVQLSGGCHQTTGPEPLGGFNLLTNPSFEYYGSGSLNQWYPKDTTVLHFSSSVPPNGGSWSIAISNTWFPGYAIRQTIPATPGSHVYRLSCWSKGDGVMGGFWLSVKKAGEIGSVVRKSQLVVDSTWTYHAIVDTIAANDEDSLIVGLGGGAIGTTTGVTWFDLCSLEQLAQN